MGRGLGRGDSLDSCRPSSPRPSPPSEGGEGECTNHIDMRWLRICPNGAAGSSALIFVVALLVSLSLPGILCAAEDVAPKHPRPWNAGDEAFWLQNMVWYHRFTMEEMTRASGLDAVAIAK